MRKAAHFNTQIGGISRDIRRRRPIQALLELLNFKLKKQLIYKRRLS
jgi:hypothetical protein